MRRPTPNKFVSARSAGAYYKLRQMRRLTLNKFVRARSAGAYVNNNHTNAINMPCAVCVVCAVVNGGGRRFARLCAVCAANLHKKTATRDSAWRFHLISL